jgi:hypothetical protein
MSKKLNSLEELANIKFDSLAPDFELKPIAEIKSEFKHKS